MSISENANKTAQWWVDQLKSPSVKLDNGTADSGLLAVLAFCGPKSTDYTDEQVDIFRSYLAQHIESEIAEWGDCMIAVDYDPDDTLRKAAEQSGIKLSGQDLPWKTWTRATADKVILSYGYAAPQIEL